MSNVIKASQYATVQERRIIEHKWTLPPFLSQDGEPAETTELDAAENTESMQEMLAEMETLRRQAEAEILRMKENARREVEEWRNQEREAMERLKEQCREEARQQGFQEGFEQGYEQGAARAVQEYQEKIEQAARIILEAESERRRRLNELEPFLLHLAVDIAEKILHTEIARNQEHIVNMVKETLKLASEVNEVTLLVHPDDYDLLKKRAAELRSYLPGHAHLILLPDHAVQKGGCIVRSSFGSLDATIDTQLAEIRQALLKSVEGSEVLVHGMAG